MYDEIEICPLNVYHIHLTKTENITDFGKFNQNSSQEFFFLLSSLSTFFLQELSAIFRAIFAKICLQKIPDFIMSTQIGCFTLANAFLISLFGKDPLSILLYTIN